MSEDCGTSGKCVIIKTTRDFAQNESGLPHIYWAEISEANDDKFMALMSLREKLSLVRECEFDLAGIRFFEEVKHLLLACESGKGAMKALAVICPIFVMAIQKCESFAMALNDSVLYSSLARYGAAPMVINVFAEMSYLSGAFAKRVFDFGVWGKIMELCRERQDDITEGDLPHTHKSNEHR
jgi:hypothetical protein